MVKNFVNEAAFYCLNEHAEPIPMIVRTRTDDTKDDFYACPKYMRKDEEHPDGFTENEHGCKNRLSFSDAANILIEFNKIAEEDLSQGMLADYTNMAFICKNIKVVVLEYKSGKVKFGIYNRRAIES